MSYELFNFQCVIRKVVDGDTIDVDIDLGFGVWLKDERVRLMGVDAPESRSSDEVEKKYGEYSKKYVENLLPKGSVAILKTFEFKKGKYGRILGDFIIDDNDVRCCSLTELMLRDYVAIPYVPLKEIRDKLHEENRIHLKKLGKINE